MDMYEYLKVASEIISAFNIIAPYEKYSGMSAYETRNLLEEIRNSEALIKANGLAYGIRSSIGDVFYKLDGSNAAVLCRRSPRKSWQFLVPVYSREPRHADA